jgi:hypothetical protein
MSDIGILKSLPYFKELKCKYYCILRFVCSNNYYTSLGITIDSGQSIHYAEIG